MHYSWSSISTFQQCPYRGYLRYVIKPELDVEINETDPLILGASLHYGMEHRDPQAAVDYYNNQILLASDFSVNEEIKLREYVKRACEVVPCGETEVRVEIDDFLGFVDLYADKNIYDYKYSFRLNVSPQMSIYKGYMQKLGYEVDKLFYVGIPKINIRQKKTETLEQFRLRLTKSIKEIEIREVDYDLESVKAFAAVKSEIKKCKKFDRQESRLCAWCEYQDICQNGGIMKLPKAERVERKNDKSIKVGIYGEAFSGKTTFANQAPMPLMLNTDGNVKFVDAPSVKLQDKDVLDGRMTKHVFGWQTLKDAISELEKDKQDFETVVLDLVEDAYELCRSYMLTKRGWEHESDDSFRAWDIVRKEFIDTMRRITNLPMNVILISHEDANRDITKASGNKITAVKPHIQDKVAKKLAGMVDVVARVVVSEDGHRLQFKQSEVVFGGGRIDLAKKDIPLNWVEFEKLFNNETKENDNGKQ